VFPVQECSDQSSIRLLRALKSMQRADCRRSFQDVAPRICIPRLPPSHPSHRPLEDAYSTGVSHIPSALTTGFMKIEKVKRLPIFKG
jgi:hypothetical protein